MAIPAMISEFGKQQLNYGMSVGQSLAQLGQQVGQQLAQREYQRQAAEALPAMQESYRNAFGKIQQGDISGGYMDVLNTSMQFGSTQNPFLMGYIEQANKFAKEAGDATLSQAWQNIQRGGAAGAAMGGGMGGEGMPGMGGSAEVDLETPLPDWETTEEQPRIPSQLDIIDQIRGLAQGETNQQFAAALNKAADIGADPAKEKLRQEVAKNVEAFNRKNENEKLKSFNTKLYDASQASEEEATIIPGAERVLGKGVSGIYFSGGLKQTGVASSGKAAWTMEDAAGTIQSISGSISKLNEGEVGDFLANSGGIFNTSIKSDVIKGGAIKGSGGRTEPDQEVLKIKNKQGEELVYTGSSDDLKRLRIAYEDVKSSPGTLNTYKASNTGFLYSPPPKSEGPTRELAKGMPALQQSAPASSFASQDDVINAVKAGQLTREQAKSILQNQFGYK
jgi:hypothetical protein